MPFLGRTGSANHQVLSISGALGFKGLEVVIATRGTQPKNIHDWRTNFDMFQNTLSAFNRYIKDDSVFAANKRKDSQIVSQLFNGMPGGLIANGFLRTHLSSRDFIKEKIENYAKSINVPVEHLNFTAIGHSKGGAKAQLNGLFVATEFGAKNVTVMTFQSPRVFDEVAARAFESIIGKENIIRFENKSSNWWWPLTLDFDPVIYVAPNMLGFKHAGSSVTLDNNKWFAVRHSMGQVTAEIARAVNIAQWKRAAAWNGNHGGNGAAYTSHLEMEPLLALMAGAKVKALDVK